MEWLISPTDFYPQLSLEMLAFVRIGYGIIMLATLLITLPNRRFFLSEKWGGYAKSARDVDWIQNPVAYPIVQFIWMGCCLLLIMGYWTVWAALVNVLLARYFFVYMRWKGVARGMGAPGFMSYWMGMGIFILEYTRTYAQDYHRLALLAVQVDYAFIMFSAGFYKLNAGYAHKNGMELGAANPQWGFWPEFYTKRPPDHWMMQFFNQMAWITEIVAAIFMLIAPLRFIGGLLIFFSFAFLTSQIRLGWLAQLVMLCSMVFFHPNSIGNQLLSKILPEMTTTNPQLTIPDNLNLLFAGIIWAYIILLPLAHLGVSYNFYMKKRLPALMQAALERYTNFFGIIVWRVFSQDLVNFYLLIYHQNEGTRTRLNTFGWKGGGFLNRYNHVCESIVLTSLFTTLKYYPSNEALFQERLLRYSRTLQFPPKNELVYEYVSLQRKPDGSGIEHVTVAEFIVNLQMGTVIEHSIQKQFSTKAPIAISPVHEGQRPGSYVPLAESK